MSFVTSGGPLSSRARTSRVSRDFLVTCTARLSGEYSYQFSISGSEDHAIIEGEACEYERKTVASYCKQLRTCRVLEPIATRRVVFACDHELTRRKGRELST